jgi:hypothetical protein
MMIVTMPKRTWRNSMPTKLGQDSKGCYAQWGSGKKYYYKCGDKQARERAKRKADKQGQAVHASGY